MDPPTGTKTQSVLGYASGVRLRDAAGKRDREMDRQKEPKTKIAVFYNLTSEVTPSVLPHLTGHTDQPWHEAVGEGLHKSVNPRRTNQWGPPLSLANTQKAKELVPEETSQHPLPLMAQ